MDSEVKKVERIVAECVDQITEVWTPVWDALVEMVRKTGEVLAAVGETLLAGVKQSPEWTFVLAYAWACGAYPEWVKMLNRTKKKRTRKKYQDRILRAYLESQKEG